MDTVGRYLKRTREARAMSLEEVSRATRIPVASIEQIEGDHFDDLPGEVFVRGFLRAYARKKPRTNTSPGRSSKWSPSICSIEATGMRVARDTSSRLIARASRVRFR